MKTFIINIIVGFLALYLATLLISGVLVIGGFTQQIKVLIISGIVLGIVNSLLKPIVGIITIPLKIITLGLFGLVVNMLMVWIVDIIFPSLIINGIIPLFWISLLICFLNFIIFRIFKKS